MCRAPFYRRFAQIFPCSGFAACLIDTPVGARRRFAPRVAGIAMSNSILIVEFAHHLRSAGRSVSDAIIESCRVRLRPILMTSLATIIGLLPMAFKLGAGSESYAPLARALIGGLTASVLLTVFLVPAGYFLVYQRKLGGSNEVPVA